MGGWVYTNTTAQRREGDIMKNKDLPAMRHAIEVPETVTKREYFAAHAPEMPPHWLGTFEYKESEEN